MIPPRDTEDSGNVRPDFSNASEGNLRNISRDSRVLFEHIHPERQVLLRHQSQLLNILNMVGLSLIEAKSKLEPVQDIQFLGLRLYLDQGRASLSVSKAQEIMAHACRISSQKILSYTEVSQFMGSLNWASGHIPLGRLHLRPLQRHFHSLGLTNRFSPPRSSDPLVLATLLRQWQESLSDLSR